MFALSLGFGLGDCTLLIELPLLQFHFQEHINKSQEIQKISRTEKEWTKRKEEIFHLFARQHYLWDCDWGHTLKRLHLHALDRLALAIIDSILLSRVSGSPKAFKN